MRRPTIVDIAKAAGVSKGAVSYALNGRPGVSDATRRRILDIAEQLGWAPSSAARALSDGRAGAIGMVVDRPAKTLAAEPFFMRLIGGIQFELDGSPVSLMLRSADDRDVEMATYQRWHAERRVDGVLLVDLRRDDPRLSFVKGLGLPAVVIGGPEHTQGLPCAWTDDSNAMGEVVRYLASLGHRRIARVAGPAEFVHTEVRSHAFARVAEEVGLVHAEVIHADYFDSQAAEITRALLSGPNPPSALVFDNDLMAVAALGVAQEMGVAVPDRLSIVAWDDSMICQAIRPALTAVGREVTQHGRIAASLLLEVIEGGVPRSKQTPRSRLIPRASTGPAAF
ncbi:LacI family DNA-binding transcriptional regulator [Thermobifida halotolerans]|uniref:LacI family DNA-binding transcriptional regulator n=1 Tax=Thermobifida halotolerans TaxID=483545 RepID=A0A399G243_9ACTN|nr:LacI family DNA-binding transcriptional regulator [Thermobifida halotolerans]UOE20029.1 LacI family DNA-binding transcriptional regulator [Thermobifida halotolerans]